MRVLLWQNLQLKNKSLYLLKTNRKEENPIPVLLIKDIRSGDYGIVLLKNQCILLKVIKYERSY